MREPIQSIVRPARCSSSSCTAFSISATSENLKANDACGTDVKVVVRVVTAGHIQRMQILRAGLGTYFVVMERNIAVSREAEADQLRLGLAAHPVKPKYRHVDSVNGEVSAA